MLVLDIPQVIGEVNSSIGLTCIIYIYIYVYVLVHQYIILERGQLKGYIGSV